MKKIKKTTLPPTSIRGHTKNTLPNSCVIFSFQFLDIDHSKFHFSTVDLGFIKFLFEKLQGISTMLCSEFRGDGNQGNHKTLRSHPVKWEETSQKKGFCHLPKQYQDYEPRQFAVSKKGRVFGFMKDNLFCIVWFDVEHIVYG